MNLSKEQREAIDNLLVRLSVQSSQRARLEEQAIRSLLDAPSADDVVHIGYTTQWDIDQMKIGGVGHFFSDCDEFEQNIATFAAAPTPEDAPSTALTSTQYTTAMGEAATAYFETFKHAHPLPAQFRWSEVYDAMARAAAAAKPVSADAQPASVDADVIAFLTDVSQQKPEKPDYWSSCGQCERNQDRAEDLLAAIAQRAKEQS